MASSNTKTIPDIFQASKRLRVDAVVNATGNSTINAVDEMAKTGSLGQKNRKVGTAAKAGDAFDLYPLPGFEPPPLQGVRQQSTHENDLQLRAQNEEETISGEDSGVKLNKEQRMRMELNKVSAQGKRNLRMCEENIAQAYEQGERFPDFQNLLVEKSWQDILKGEFAKEYMRKLHTFVGQEAGAKVPIYPPPALIFNAFHCCPFDKVKVVVIGQDPYHGPGQAMGLSFSVPQGTKVPSSLVNIFKEISDDVGSTIPSHGNLEKWAHQGVLLLNAVLTVREHHANSHSKKGWEPFTDATIRAVSQKHKGIVFLLWGNSAHDKIRLIDTKEHHILKAAHPSGLSAHKGFFKCRHFSKTNEILESAGKLPIDWQL